MITVFGTGNEAEFEDKPIKWKTKGYNIIPFRGVKVINPAFYILTDIEDNNNIMN